MHTEGADDVSGSAILGITVAQNFRRKTKMTITTRPIVSNKVNCTSRHGRANRFRAISQKIEVARKTAGRCASRGNNAFTRSAVLNNICARLALDVEDDGRVASTQPANRTFSTLSTTSPISRGGRGPVFIGDDELRYRWRKKSDHSHR